MISILTVAVALVFSVGFAGVSPKGEQAPNLMTQNAAFPNELRGFELFGKGKLKQVIFGKTKKQDVERLFGNFCESYCDYDDRFVIKFDYLSCDDCMTTTYIRDRAMCPLPEYMGTIEKVTLKPKLLIQFEKVPTSRFRIHTGGAITSKDGSGGVSYESFGDEFGLKYSIRQSTSSLALTTPGPDFMNGPLYSIEYAINVDLETKIFSAPYKNCIKNNAN
jgi:hypothetical protein